MLTKDIQFSKSAGRRGTKKFLLARGIKMDEMREYLLVFLQSYGHTGLEEKKLEELLDMGSLYFISLKKYANGKRNINRNS